MKMFAVNIILFIIIFLSVFSPFIEYSLEGGPMIRLPIVFSIKPLTCIIQVF